MCAQRPRSGQSSPTPVSTPSRTTAVRTPRSRSSLAARAPTPTSDRYRHRLIGDDRLTVDASAGLPFARHCKHMAASIGCINPTWMMHSAYTLVAHLAEVKVALATPRLGYLLGMPGCINYTYPPHRPVPHSDPPDHHIVPDYDRSHQASVQANDHTVYIQPAPGSLQWRRQEPGESPAGLS